MLTRLTRLKNDAKKQTPTPKPKPDLDDDGYHQMTIEELKTMKKRVEVKTSLAQERRDEEELKTTIHLNADLI